MVAKEKARIVYTVELEEPSDNQNPNFLVDQSQNLADEISQWDGVKSVDWYREA